MKTGTSIPINSMRDDLRYRPEAIAHGWEPEVGAIDRDNAIDPINGTPQFWLQFCRKISGNVSRRLWRVRDGWRCAEQDAAGHYINHRTHRDLSTALTKETD